MGGRGKDIGEAAISFVLLKMLISVIYNGVAKITASTTRNIFKIMSKALVFLLLIFMLGYLQFFG